MTRSPRDHDPLRRFDWTAAESASQAVVAAVADESDAHPGEIEPLYGAVDTDALNALFRVGTTTRRFVGGRVTFDYLTYRVEIDSSGEGFLYPRAEATGIQSEVSQLSTPAGDG